MKKITKTMLLISAVALGLSLLTACDFEWVHGVLSEEPSVEESAGRVAPSMLDVGLTASAGGAVQGRYLGTSYEVDFSGTTYSMTFTSAHIRVIALRSFLMALDPPATNNFRFELIRNSETVLVRAASAGLMESAGMLDADSIVLKRYDTLRWKNSNASSDKHLIYTLTDR